MTTGNRKARPRALRKPRKQEVAEDRSKAGAEMRALPESQELLRSVTDGAIDTIFVLDRQGRFLLANPSMLRDHGWNLDDVIGKRVDEIHDDPEVGRRLLEHNLRIMEDGRQVVAEEVVPTSRGNRVFLVAKTPQLDAKGQVVGLVGVAHDITERKLAEKALDVARTEAIADRNRLRAVLEALPVGVSILDEKGAFLESNRTFDRIWGMEAPVQPGSKDQSPYRAWWSDSGQPVLPEQWACARVLREGVPVVGELLKIERFNGSTAYIENSAVPIRDADGRITGCAVAIMDVTQRLEAERDVRSAKEEWERTFDAVPDLIAILDCNHRIVRTNKAMARKLARTPGQCVGLTCFSCLHGTAEPPSDCPHAKTLRDGREHREEVHEAGFDGDFLVSTTPLFDDRGELTGSVHVARDLTDRRQMEKALRQSEERSRILSSATFEGIAIIENARLVDCNDQLAQILGTRREELLGRELLSVLPDEERPRILPVILEGREAHHELQMLRADGTRVTVEAHGKTVVHDGRSLRYAAVRDITERKKAERALRRLNRTLRAISESSQAMLHATSEREYLEEVCRLVVECCGHAMAWIGVGEDDAGKSIRVVARAGHDAGYLDTLHLTWGDGERGRGPTGTAIRTGKPALCTDIRTDPAFALWRTEALARGYASSIAVPLPRDGRTFGALTIYSREANALLEEEVALLFELASDLTFGIEALRLREAKDEATALLRKSEERHRALVESSPSGVLVNRGESIVYANPALLEILGATDPSQVLGEAPFTFFDPDDHALIRSQIAHLQEGRLSVPPLIELRAIRLDGTSRDVEAVGTPFEDSEGPAIQVIVRDVTERKQKDQELREALEQMRRRKEEMAALLRAARTALENRSFEEAARAIVAGCRAVLGARSAAVILVTPDEPGEVVCSDPPGDDGRPRQGAHPDLETFRRSVLSTRKRVVVDGRAAGGVSPWGGPFGSILLAPLDVGTEVVGFLEVADKPGGFTDEDGALASAFGEMAAVALLKSRTLDLLERQVEERTRQLAEANQALGSERARLFSLLDELPLFVFLSSLDRSIVFANRYFREHFGDPAGVSCFDLMGGEDSPCSSCQAATVLATDRPARWEWSKPGGGAFQITLFPFRDPDGTRFVLEVGVDVTALRRSYEAEQRARQVADSLREAILALTRSLDLDTVLTALLDHVRQLVPCDRTKVMVLEKDGRLSARAVGEGNTVTPLPQDSRTIFDPAGNAVVRQVIETGRVIVIPDITCHPEWGPRLPNAVERSWMGVPLIARGRTVGMFSVSRRAPGGFPADDVRMAEGVSAQASIAIENALLFDEIRAAQERMRTLSRRLAEVQEEERRAIARELHDETGQSLTSLLYGLRFLERTVGAAGSGDQLHELERIAQEVLENLHRLAANLRPASLDHLGLETALRQHLAGVERKTGLNIHYHARGLERERMSLAVETALYRVVQEALTNAVRHARATSVDVLLERTGDRVSVLIEDDGAGFSPEEAEGKNRLGLIGMRERAETLGGTFVLESAPGAGTTVVMEVPCADSNPDRR